ncbi:hypothetical protein AURDEDRAFT_171933 [Auricularia subglabra TFB-10046 SS5]|nr:hypothetical protein AURDEDRAFT_171933 [Auricularia subglabra TFB-10046 SS5]
MNVLPLPWGLSRMLSIAFAPQLLAGKQHSGAHLLVLLVYFTASCKATVCTDAARSAVSTVTVTGTSWMCCTKNGTCGAETPCPNGVASAQCLNVGGVKACGLVGFAYDDGAPCGAYMGTSSTGFVSSLEGTATAPVPIDLAAWHVLMNWPILGYEEDIGICCSATSCYIKAFHTLRQNECRPGYSAIKCAGDEYHGVCSTWSGDGDSGQYFLVNADVPLPPLSDVFNSSTSPTTPASHLSADISTLPDSAATASGGAINASATLTRDGGPTRAAVPSWAIALICVLAVVAVAAVSLLFARRIRAPRQTDAPQRQIDPAQSQIDPFVVRPTDRSPGVETASDGGTPLPAPPPQYAKGRASY